MIYIGLDISTKTGLAVIDSDHPLGQTICTKQITSTKIGMARADDIWEQCSKLLPFNFPENQIYELSCKILIEGYGFSRTQNLQPVIEVGSVIRYNLWLDGIEYLEVPPTSLKKFVTGKGNTKKEQMLKEVYKRFHIDCDTNDEADAVGLAYFGMAIDGKLTLPNLHMEALKNFK